MEPQKRAKRTAAEAMDDGESGLILSSSWLVVCSKSAYLGAGDFTFYGLLVCLSASAGCPLATLAALVGVLVGMEMTFACLSFETEMMPALPASALFGTVLHFGCLYMAVPFLKTAFEATPFLLI